MSDTFLRAKLEQFRGARDWLIGYRDRTFQPGDSVWVRCQRYEGPGKVSREDGCPPDLLPVQVPNGNVWWYPLEACSHQTEAAEQPVGVAEALKKFGAPPDRKLTRPIISVDRRTGQLGIFDEFDLIWGFRAFEDEAHAIKMATLWLKSFCSLEPEVVYPSIHSMRVN